MNLNINVNSTGGTLDSVYEHIRAMAETHEDCRITSANYEKFADVGAYSAVGLDTLGKIAKFPASYMREKYKSNELLATRMMLDDLERLLASGVEPVARSWNGVIEGVVSPSYNYCDDKEVFEPIVANATLNKLEVVRSTIAPMYTSVQLRGSEEFFVPGDDSPLYWGVSITNSMTGFASVMMKLFVWRLVCSNGLAIPLNTAKLVRRVHRGQKDIAAEVNESVLFLAEKQAEVQQALVDSAQAPAKILSMKEEHRADYLARKLNLGEKDANAILTLFNTIYGGESRWGMAQAIVEFARDRSNPMLRDALERRALQVA